MEITTKSAQETQKLGEETALDIVEGRMGNSSGAVVLALSGDLGSGKTMFVQGLASGLKVKQRVVSPTFIIVRKYDLKPKTKSQKLKDFYHVDLYRLDENVDSELENLGLKEIWSDSRNIVVIEWAEKARKFIPKDALWIDFSYENDERKVIFRK